ncbi:MAG: hypothetical protein IJS15_11915 [Victivallales bacterium]|nr:hypothetical protein [Victivallales bacterium]
MKTKLTMLLGVAAFCVYGQNLLLNPSYEFHSFQNHRSGNAANYYANSAAFWDYDAYGDMTVTREAHVSGDKRPNYSVHNIVSVKAGKSIYQVMTLPEAGLAHGDSISMQVSGWQGVDGAAAVMVELLKIDSEDGTWTPSECGMSDGRTFPKHARGELVVARRHEAKAEKAGAFTLKLSDIKVEGHYTTGEESRSSDMNTVAVRVTLSNLSESGEALFWSPALVRGVLPEKADGIIPSSRPMEPIFANIPKTMQKLWRGESLHIIMMGSSIDRGSANPPIYLYDENPESPDFKKPLSDRLFEADKIGHPEYDGYFGWWQHYFSYGGRLRLELMRKFNLPINKVMLNMMACDGSNIAEATSGLEAYCTLAHPPSENGTGHKTGGDWRTLYPDLFTRPQGPGPDLVIFGSGANEKTDTPSEGAVFEASIRWIQQRYPDCEFIFCVFQNRGGYTPNSGDLMAIALRYQIPFMDYGKLCDDITRWCNPRTLVPRDGHPQAVGHYFWFKTLERAFEAWDPVPAGKAQLRLPSRLYQNSIGWEGVITTYKVPHPRIVNGKFVVLDDTAFNLWGTGDEKNRAPILADSRKVGTLRPNPRYDDRNSSFRHGNLTLGDRHVIEVNDENASITAIDMKTVNGRVFHPVSSKMWRKPGEAVPFESQCGAPYGTVSITLEADAEAEIAVPATDLSIAYADAEEGGALVVLVDGKEALRIEANQPFIDVRGEKHFMENRRGVLHLPYGMHKVTVKAERAPVKLLGLFAYDTRPNRDAERVVNGTAVAGEEVTFIPPFKATPVIHTFGDVRLSEATPSSAKFTGTSGSFMAIGE